MAEVITNLFGLTLEKVHFLCNTVFFLKSLSAQQILSLGRDGPDIGLAGYLSSMLDRPHTGSKKIRICGDKMHHFNPIYEGCTLYKGFFQRKYGL